MGSIPCISSVLGPPPVPSPRSEDGCHGPGVLLKWGSPELLQEGWASRETPVLERDVGTFWDLLQKRVQIL